MYVPPTLKYHSAPSPVTQRAPPLLIHRPSTHELLSIALPTTQFKGSNHEFRPSENGQNGHDDQASRRRAAAMPYQTVGDFLSNTSRFNIIESTLREGEQFANAFFDAGTKVKMCVSHVRMRASVSRLHPRNFLCPRAIADSDTALPLSQISASNISSSLRQPRLPSRVMILKRSASWA